MENFTLKFQAVAEKTANNFSGSLFCCTWHIKTVATIITIITKASKLTTITPVITNLPKRFDCSSHSKVQLAQFTRLGVCTLDPLL